MTGPQLTTVDLQVFSLRIVTLISSTFNPDSAVQLTQRARREPSVAKPMVLCL
jgi:hypothetical protein